MKARMKKPKERVMVIRGMEKSEKRQRNNKEEYRI